MQLLELGLGPELEPVLLGRHRWALEVEHHRKELEVEHHRQELEVGHHRQEQGEGHRPVEGHKLKRQEQQLSQVVE